MNHKKSKNKKENDSFRIELDSMGEIRVPSDAMWGAQTQRSLENFPIGSYRMPLLIIKSYLKIKAAAALANFHLGRLDDERYRCISKAIESIESQKMWDEFPLKVFQTGSGTQTNMNVNEVIANLGNIYAGKALIHPNDHVNMSQSSNDTFPTALKISIIYAVEKWLLPSLQEMISVLIDKEKEFTGVIKVGRTHLQDAAPIRVSGEIAGWRKAIEMGVDRLKDTLKELYTLPIGGTAVGSGLNAPCGFDKEVVGILNDNLSLQGNLVSADSKYYSMSFRDDISAVSDCVANIGGSLFKIVNDIRWLACGPSCGIGELILPANEPGSSIMPGKVNPTQCEALAMVCSRVFGNQATINFATSQGHFQLNTYMPIMAHVILESIEIMSDGINSFVDRCLKGIQLNIARIDQHNEKNLMLITALNTIVGYEKAAYVAKKAQNEDRSVKEVIIEEGILDEKDADILLDPHNMI